MAARYMVVELEDSDLYVHEFEKYADVEDFLEKTIWKCLVIQSDVHGAGLECEYHT